MAATALRYADAPVGVRDDIQESHRHLWRHLAEPGCWWTGEQKLAIARESRRAPDCPLCRERRTALSPSAVAGAHAASEGLSETAVDVVHRVRSDPGRLTRGWYERVRSEGLGEEAYVELVGIVALLAGVDAFARALGVPLRPLPRPRPGEPSRRRPRDARPSGAWVAMIAPEEASGPEADIYGSASFVPNIVRALSLVPGHVRVLRELSNAHYVPIGKLSDPSVGRSLDRTQLELVAARVSALNECFY